MRLWRIRLEMDDRPGSLAAVGVAVAAMGGRVAHLDVHVPHGDRCSADLIIDTAVPLDAPLIDLVLRDVATVVHLRPADAHELTDPVTRWLEPMAALAARDRLSTDAVRQAVADLTGADLSWVGPVAGIEPGGLAARALADGNPHQRDEPVKRARRGTRPWTLAVPGRLHGRRFVVLLTRTVRFSYTETARVQAVLRIAETLTDPYRRGVFVDEQAPGPVNRH